ncbi:MAG: PilW family protein [Pseudomonadota bacterium]
MKPVARSVPPRRPVRGLSLVELMVALVLGLVLTFGLASVYLSSKTAFVRQGQLSSVQQSVRTAFEYLATDLRMAGHYGCYTGSSSAPAQPGLSTADLAANFSIGVAGYEYSNATADAYTLTSSTPTNVTTASSWEIDAGTGIDTIPVTTIGGAAGLTPGSDVLVVRSVTGRPMRLTASTVSGSSMFSVEAVSGGKCGSGADKLSGFCTGSYGLIANCAKARIFSADAVAAAGAAVNITAGGATNFESGEYAPGTAEVFPMQTVAYYIKASSSGNGTSLYRRVFDGTVAAGVEQELIEGVENMQVTYGRDRLPAADPDGAVDDYVTADEVQAAEWPHIVAVRVSLLIRASDPIESGLQGLPASAPVNGVVVTFPSAGPKYDRRVFTTTVAIRNKIG